MLTSFQLLALAQGIFILFLLIKRKRLFNKFQFRVFFIIILSLINFALGDDDYHLIFKNVELFYLQEPLIITLFALFVRFYKLKVYKIRVLDILITLPYIIDILFNWLISDANEFSVVSLLIESTYLVILVSTFIDIYKNKKNKWLSYINIALGLLMLMDLISYALYQSNDTPLLFDSYFTFIIIILFYYIVLYQIIEKKLIVNNERNDIIPVSEKVLTEPIVEGEKIKYKNTNIKEEDIEIIKLKLKTLMSEEKLFRNQKLTVNEVAKNLEVSRLTLSEILNVHLQMSFQQYINKIRIQDFIELIESGKYKNYSILGISEIVGFNSKSTFNTVFKKEKGITPSAYIKKNLNDDN